MSIQDGGPAFPVADYDHMVFEPKTVAETKRDLSGMSLRDYFAGQFMAGRAAVPGTVDHTWDSIQAYEAADAMLAARSA